MGTNQAKQTEFRTLGLGINFPFQPYGTQRAMMNKITATLCNQEHALIESPTGTGKTLVLLCSTLAWRAHSKILQQPFISLKRRQRKMQEHLDKIKSRPCTCGQESYEDCCKKLKRDDDVIILCERCQALDAHQKFMDLGLEEEVDSSGQDVVGKINCRIPNIYYGTRTHKQITQVIRELNKTIYKKDLKMCILSSRERTCLNEDIKDYPDRNEQCRVLVDNTNKKKDPICEYYQDAPNFKSVYDTINVEFSDQAWDIEQLVEFGKNNKSCPYFGVRKLQQDADITFCPYNYLLDPTIRDTLDINIKNSIIIIDEAHNLEDICRDSSSFIINTKQIDNILETISIGSSHYVQGSPISDAYIFFRDKFFKLKFFLVKFPYEPADRDAFDNSEKKILTNERMLKELEKMGLGKENLPEFKAHLQTLKGDDEDSDDKKSKSGDNDDNSNDAAFNSNQLQSIKQLTIALDFMYTGGDKSVLDFRAVISKTLDKEPTKFNPRRSEHQSTDQLTNDTNYVSTLSLLCMNPAVAFNKIHSSAWSVIVASGTLSPIESLKTELGCTFTQPFEGGHVINANRIFASIVSYGPNNRELNCAYTNCQRLDFQDEVGYVLRDVCKTVPKGVLCFFPSYDRMETFCLRWLAKGILKEIESYKGSIFKEQRKLTAVEFEKVLNKYNKRAKGKGALLLGVFRGKISEGIDFADDAARAVITVGIPYPNVKEVGVGLKKDYNDIIRRSSPQIMAGGDWYACQAFRALNQALGRCIRHKDDWGAILLIDSRLRSTHANKNLSKWLQSNLVNTKDYSEILTKLQDFVMDKNKIEY